MDYAQAKHLNDTLDSINQHLDSISKSLYIISGQPPVCDVSLDDTIRSMFGLQPPGLPPDGLQNNHPSP